MGLGVCAHVCVHVCVCTLLRVLGNGRIGLIQGCLVNAQKFRSARLVTLPFLIQGH